MPLFIYVRISIYVSVLIPLHFCVDTSIMQFKTRADALTRAVRLLSKLNLQQLLSKLNLLMQFKTRADACGAAAATV